MQNESVEKYVSSLKREDNSIWKPIKKQEKTQNNVTPNTQMFKTSGTMRKWRQRKKAELFAEYLSEVLSPHNIDQDQEEEQDLAAAIQSQERLTEFTLKEIKDEIKMLNQKKKKRHQLSTLLLPEC